MSERFRESALSALVTSKRFIVAACAAIAMVLGAMSGGASFFTPITHRSGTQDNVGVVITANNQTGQPPSPAKDNTFTKQHAIEPQKLFTSTAATINNTATSTKKSAVSTNAAVTVPVANLFLSEIQLPLSIAGTADNTSSGVPVTAGTSSGSSTASSTNPTATTTGTAAATTDPTQTTTTDPGTSTTTPPSADPVTPDQNTNQQPPATNPSN